MLLYRWTYGAVKNTCMYILDKRRKYLFFHKNFVFISGKIRLYNFVGSTLAGCHALRFIINIIIIIIDIIIVLYMKICKAALTV